MHPFVRQMLVILSLVAVAACRRATPVPAAPEVGPAPVATASPPAGPGADAAAPDDEVRRRAEAEADASRRREARARLETPIYFGLDRTDLDGEAEQLLEDKLSILQGARDVRLRIAGHADERGADEYNLALGQRRAAAVRRWLEARGVAPGRLEVVSFGEERPVCTDADESCWQRNRRAEFDVLGGALAEAGR